MPLTAQSVLANRGTNAWCVKKNFIPLLFQLKTISFLIQIPLHQNSTRLPLSYNDLTKDLLAAKTKSYLVLKVVHLNYNNDDNDDFTIR